MSYDLMVFSASVAPRTREEFLEWYDSEPYESEDGVNDASATSPDLRAWYSAITAKFPDYNTEDFDVDGAGDFATGYAIGPTAIYADFRWSKAEEAYDIVRSLAVIHGVGVYDVSGDAGDIHYPGDSLPEPSTGVWREISADFQSGDISKYVASSEPKRRSWLDFFRRSK